MWTTNYKWNYEEEQRKFVVLEEALEQFTGLLDMDGNPIYRKRQQIGFDLNDKRRRSS